MCLKGFVSLICIGDRMEGWIEIGCGRMLESIVMKHCFYISRVRPCAFL